VLLACKLLFTMPLILALAHHKLLDQEMLLLHFQHNSSRQTTVLALCMRCVCLCVMPIAL